MIINRLIFTSLVVAEKFFSDTFQSNKAYSAIGGIKVEELNELEIEFICKIEGKLYINDEDLKNYISKINEKFHLDLYSIQNKENCDNIDENDFENKLHVQ